MTPEELELLAAAGNCHDACGEDFDSTVRMISSSRKLDPNAVKKLLMRLKEKYANDKDYIRLRKRLPDDFPV